MCGRMKFLGFFTLLNFAFSFSSPVSFKESFLRSFKHAIALPLTISTMAQAARAMDGKLGTFDNSPSLRHHYVSACFTTIEYQPALQGLDYGKVRFFD